MFNGKDDKEDNVDLYKLNYVDWNGNNYEIDFRPPF